MEPAIVCLRKGEERGVRAGAVWIFDNQIDWINDLCTDGGIVEIVDQKERFLARGYFNRKSKITVRILTHDAQESIDRAFFARRIARAWSFRQTLGLTNACRVVFGESDGLPGLTVDKFGDCLSFQTVALGIDRWKPDIISILVDLFHPVCIYERNDVPVREKEGLPRQTGCVYGSLPDSVVIQEHDAKMLVDIAHGQKTGHFLDQQENRGRIRPYVPAGVCSIYAVVPAAFPSTLRSMAPNVSKQWMPLRKPWRWCRKTPGSTASRLKPPAPMSLTWYGNTPMPVGNSTL